MDNISIELQENTIIEAPKLIETISEKKLTKLDVLKRLSSGTLLREGINDIISANTGALIIIYNPLAQTIFQGGFRIDCKFTPKKLAELAKMDGAIILSENSKKILYANTLLIPDTTISSSETGTRHQAAERTAKQTNTIVIAVSQRKKEITIYYQNSKYVLQHTEDLLRRATETLQILEKQREIFNENLTNLNILEMTGLVSISEVCQVLQRIEMIKKIANIINEHIIELGKNSSIVRMRLRELTKGIEKEEALIIKDYLKRPIRSKTFLTNLNFEELLDLEKIAKNLFKKELEKEISPKGYRILSKLNISKTEIEHLIKLFENLHKIINSPDEKIRQVLKGNLESFKKDFNHLREQIIIGKKI